MITCCSIRSLDWYDIQARQYDAIGVSGWNAIDPSPSSSKRTDDEVTTKQVKTIINKAGKEPSKENGVHAGKGSNSNVNKVKKVEKVEDE